MFSHFEKAATGDVKYIESYIKNHADRLNLPWDGTGYDPNYEGPLALGQAPVNLFLVIVAWPIGLLTTAATVYGLEKIKQHKAQYTKQRTGWTLLEFAAEGGHYNVARLLITAGVNTNNAFMAIARANGHHQFVTNCEVLLEKMAKEEENRNLLIENKLSRSKQKITQINLIVSEYKCEEWKTKYHALLKEYIDLDNSIKNKTKLAVDDVKLAQTLYQSIVLYLNPLKAAIDALMAEKNAYVLTADKEYGELWYNTLNKHYEELQKKHDAAKQTYHETVGQHAKQFDVDEWVKRYNTIAKVFQTKIDLHINDQLISEDDYQSIYNASQTVYYHLVEFHQTSLTFCEASKSLNDDVTTKQYNLFKAEYEKQLQEYNTNVKIFSNIKRKPREDDIPSVNKQGFFKASAAPKKFAFGLVDKNVAFIAGDCFYDAVVANKPADKAWTKDSKNDLRKSVYDELKANKQKYLKRLVHEDEKNIQVEFYDNETKKFIYETYATYEAYCQAMATARESVDHVELAAFCRANKVACAVIDEQPNVEYPIQGKKYITDDNPPIFLGRINHNHYVALAIPSGKSWKDIVKNIEDHNDNLPRLKK